MPALPPVDLDSWRRWAADRWRRTTDQAIGAVGSHGWDLDAGRRIDALSTPLAPVAAPPMLEPAAEPEPVYGPPGPPPDWAPPSQPPPLAAAPAAQWVPFEAARQQAAGAAREWSQAATQRIEGLGTELAALPAGLGQGFQSAVGADQGLGQTMTAIGAGVQGPAPTAGQVQFPGTPAELTLPETGTPEGETITSALAETATRGTPGAGLLTGLARRVSGQEPSVLFQAQPAAERPATWGEAFARMQDPNDPRTQAYMDLAMGATEALRGPGGEALGAIQPGSALRRRVGADVPVGSDVPTPTERRVGQYGRAPREALDRLASLQDEAANVASTDPASRASLLGNVLEVFNNYSLAGPLSLVTNLTSGLTQTALNVGEAVGAAGPAGAARFVRGAAGAVPRAVREAGRVLVEGTQAPGASLGSTTQELALPGGLSEGRGFARSVGTWATRLNAATDRAIGTVNDAGGRALGEQLGFSGPQLDDFAKRYAEEATYAGKPSALGQLLTAARRRVSDPSASAGDRLWGGFVYSLAPYIRVPERILRQAGDLTTFGGIHLKEVLGKDPAVRAHARGRIGAAIATTVAIGYQAAHGAVTGDGPENPDERAAMEAQTNAAGDPLWRRNSFKVEVPGAGPGGSSRLFWFPNRMLGAVGEQMDLVANAVDAYGQERAKPGAAGAGPRGDVAATWAGGKALVNEVVATALGDSWLDDLTRFAERSRGGHFLEAAGETAAGIASRPLAAAAPLARATDPYAREVERGDVLGRALERIPGLRERLPARIGPTTGEPVRQAGTPLERAAGVATGVVAPTDLDRELGRLRLAGQPVAGVREFRPGQEVYGVKQERAAIDALRQAYGSETARYLRAAIADPAYRQADDATKAKILQDAQRTAAAEADIRVGTKAQRDPKARATYEYAAVPQFRGVGGTPDEVRRQNLAIREAKNQLETYRRLYPGGGGRDGEARFREQHNAQYELARRQPLDERFLAEERATITRRVGVPPDEVPIGGQAQATMAGTVR